MTTSNRPRGALCSWGGGGGRMEDQAPGRPTLGPHPGRGELRTGC